MREASEQDNGCASMSLTAFTIADHTLLVRVAVQLIHRVRGAADERIWREVVRGPPWEQNLY